MSELDDEERQQIYEGFRERVNMAPKELERWLESEESRAVGDTSGSSRESTGHRSGRRILEIQRKRKADLEEEDYRHMRKVVGYVNRHTAQRPSGDVRETPWRYSLMNWGHDPLKE